MLFVTLVCKNLLRRSTRSVLTIVGIAVGIAAVVALTSIAWGFETSWVHAYTARGTDLVVTKVMSESPIPAPFDQHRASEILDVPHVVQASGMLTDLMSIEDASTMLVYGWPRGTFVWEHLRLVEGRWPANDDERVVVLGSVAKDILKKTVGASVQIETTTFTVCGVFESDAVLESGAVVMTLPRFQETMDQAGKINFLNVKLAPGTTSDQVAEIRQAIAARWPGFKAYTASEVAGNNSAIRVAKAMSWATSGIALVVGAISVMNTMLMSVFERLHEIGILLAVGWRRGRIVRMVLYESIVLSVIGGSVGVLTGAIVVLVLERTDLLRGKITGEFSLFLFALSLGISVTLGVLGGLYPAYRGACMPPSEALHYE